MFNILFPQLKQLERLIKLTLIGVKNEQDIPEIMEYFEDSPNICVDILEGLDWEDDHWVYSEIKKFDIGVSPLVNHLFNVSKSAFKVKQYLSVGVPAVASDVGENNRFIQHNANGFLCQNNDSFKDAIEHIINMSNSDYFKLSTNALQSQRHFSMKKYCDLLIRTCEELIHEGSSI
jgi:glycosyltransferase involved in cell wall biosynthesis